MRGRDWRHAGAALRPGASDTQIVLGQTVPFSGPVSVAGSGGHALLVGFAAVNTAGGINGRQVKLLALDDGYLPPKTVEVTCRLVEDGNALLMYGPLGTPTNAAVEKRLNQKKVPHLFITSGASRFKDPKDFPWTMGYIPGYAADVCGFLNWASTWLHDAAHATRVSPTPTLPRF